MEDVAYGGLQSEGVSYYSPVQMLESNCLYSIQAIMN